MYQYAFLKVTMRYFVGIFAWINGTTAAHCQKREIASFLLILSPIKVCQKFEFVGGFSDFQETFDSREIFQ